VKLKNVILTGIGPGDPELLTLKAYNLIKVADVILYDSEQVNQVLALAGKHAEIIKINKDHTLSYDFQVDQIVDVIERKYLAGKLVVRLKVGDAFLFGRGGTEITKIQARGIKCDVIPGISAGIAASNMKKIKISEKNEADCVVFYMANQKEDQNNNLLSVTSNLKSGFTLVLYMAEGRIGQIAQRLIEKGVSGEIKVIATSNVSAANEMIRCGVLSDVAEKEEWNLIVPQTTFFIGKYVDIV
jgi:uroporphyrin-III C-methyltransferase